MTETVSAPAVVQAFSPAASAFLQQLAVRAEAGGLQLVYTDAEQPIEVVSGARKIRLAPRNYLYAHDMVSSFDYYFGAVAPTRANGVELVDYSRPARHTLVGSKQKLYFTSLPESWLEAKVYLDYLAPRPGEVVLDLGAYCGLSAITFAEAVGPTGRVISLEPDPENFAALKRNLPAKRYPNVQLLRAAVSAQAGPQWFSGEGNMGSHVIADPALNRDRLVEVQGLTLAGLMQRFGLDSIDIVKMDIEGGEYGVLESAASFLRTVRARWFVEAHERPSGQGVDLAGLRRIFERNGYLVHQLSKPAEEEHTFPLLYAVPIPGWPFD